MGGTDAVADHGFGQVIDVLVSQKRDLAATRRFFTRADAGISVALRRL